MKRIQLIEWGVVTVGLVFGFKFFEGIFSVIAQILFEFEGYFNGSGLLKLVILYAIYAAAFIMLIRKSPEIANWINGSAKNETLPIKIERRSLLQVVLIALCIATILPNIAQIIMYLIDTFQNEAGKFHEPTDNSIAKHKFKISAIESIVAFVVMYFSHDISGWFMINRKPDELTLESEPENDN